MQPRAREGEMSKKESLKVKYTGSNSIDLRNLGKSLQATQELIDFITISQFGEKLNIDIKPFKKGSFEYVIELASTPQALAMLYSFGTTEGNTEILKWVFSMFEKLFKAKEEREKVQEVRTEGDNSPITNNTTNITNNYKIESLNLATEKPLADFFKDPEAPAKSITKFSQSVTDAGEKEYKVTTLDEKEEVLYLDKERLLKHSNPLKKEESSTSTTRTFEAMLTPKKPDLTGKSQWEFLQDGSEIIKATIEDEEFKDMVNSGFGVSKGMVFKTLLGEETTQKKNQKTLLKYTVKKVFEINDQPLSFYSNQTFMTLERNEDPNYLQ